VGGGGEHVVEKHREPEAGDGGAGVNVELEAAWGPNRDQVEEVAWGSPHAGQVELQERERARQGLSALECAARNSARARSLLGEGGREGSYHAAPSMSSGAPCGACKFLRRKCVRGCIFAPYFGAEQGAARFAAVHKIFGASNVAKLLLHIPVPRRCDAVLTISYEAQARLSDPVYGCVATIFALQQQVPHNPSTLFPLLLITHRVTA
jgi:hypothetical protein